MSLRGYEMLLLLDLNWHYLNNRCSDRLSNINFLTYASKKTSETTNVTL